MLRVRAVVRSWIAVLVGFSLTASAQTQTATAGPSAAEIAARREIVQQAQAAADANDHRRALELALRAGQIQMTPSLRMFIAQQQEAVGQLADALGNVDLCIRETERDAGASNRDVILANCRELYDALRTRVGRVVVRIAESAPASTQVTVSGQILNRVLYRLPYVVNPGAVPVRVAVGTQVVFEQSVNVPAGATVNVDVPDATLAAAAQQQPQQQQQQQPVTVRPGLGPGSFVVMGVGGLSLGLSALFFALRNGATSQLEMSCDRVENRFICDNNEMTRSQLGSAGLFNGLLNGTLIGGGVLLLGGVVWTVVAATRPGSTETNAPRVSLLPTSNGAMLSIGGAL